MTRTEFVQRLSAARPELSPAEIKSEMNRARQEVGPFEDDKPIQEPVATPEQSPNEQTGPKFTPDATAYAVAPRTAAAAEAGKGMGAQVAGAALDVLSAPLRAGASAVNTAAEQAAYALQGKKAPQSIGQQFQSEMAKTTGDGLVENTLRDPTSAIPGLGALKTPVKGMAGAVVKGLRGLMSAGSTAVVHQGENVAKGEEVDVGTAGIETGANLGIAGLSKVVPKIAEAVSNVPGRVKKVAINTILQPVTKMVDDGYAPDNVIKYKVLEGAGSIDDVAKKVGSEISTRMDAVNKLVQTQAPQASINPIAAIDRAVKKLSTRENMAKFDRLFTPSSAGAQALPIENAKERLIEYLGKLDPNTKNWGYVDLNTANVIRRAMGAKASKVFTKELAEEEAINVLAVKTYMEMRDEITKALPKEASAEFKRLNSEISDLIPIEAAALRSASKDVQDRADESIRKMITGAILKHPKTAQTVAEGAGATENIFKGLSKAGKSPIVNVPGKAAASGGLKALRTSIFGQKEE